MSQRRARTSWIDQFVLRDDVSNPFVQVVLAAQQIGQVAEDRVGLSRRDYEAVDAVRREARVIEDLARLLDDEVSGCGIRADEALAGGLDPATRARELTAALTASVRATATLVETCGTLLALTEQLVVIRRPLSRLKLMAAVGAVRAAASTAHLTVLVNLQRITDVTLYDELVAGMESFDVTLAQANRVTAALRSEVWVGQSLPRQAQRALR